LIEQVVDPTIPPMNIPMNSMCFAAGAHNT